MYLSYQTFIQKDRHALVYPLNKHLNTTKWTQCQPYLGTDRHIKLGLKYKQQQWCTINKVLLKSIQPNK